MWGLKQVGKLQWMIFIVSLRMSLHYFHGVLSWVRVRQMLDKHISLHD